MFCPSCRQEYDLNELVCKNCEIPLVDTLPEEKVPERPPHIVTNLQHVDRVTVLTTSNMSELDDARAALEEADVEYHVKGGGMPGYPGGGRLGYIPREGPMGIEVATADEAVARDIVRHLREDRNQDET